MEVTYRTKRKCIVDAKAFLRRNASYTSLPHIRRNVNPPKPTSFTYEVPKELTEEGKMFWETSQNHIWINL